MCEAWNWVSHMLHHDWHHVHWGMHHATRLFTLEAWLHNSRVPFQHFNLALFRVATTSPHWLSPCLVLGRLPSKGSFHLDKSSLGFFFLHFEDTCKLNDCEMCRCNVLQKFGRPKSQLHDHSTSNLKWLSLLIFTVMVFVCHLPQRLYQGFWSLVDTSQNGVKILAFDVWFLHDLSLDKISLGDSL